MSNFNPLGGSTTTGTSADHGFLSAFSHWLSSILDIITSLLHSTIAFVQFIFALAYDVLQSVFNITKCVTFTAVSFVSGVARSVLGLFQGVVGFIAANFITIALCIGAYYLYTSYQRQSPNQPISATAKNTVTDAAARVQRDAQNGYETYSGKVKAAVDSTAESLPSAKKAKN